jgi:hypothetical protein
LKTGKEALEILIRKMNGAYHERLTKGPKDYPPYALTSWDDRSRYDTFIRKLIAETMEEIQD